VLSAIAGTPLAVKIAAKMIVAYPVTFHVMNGVRHLVWDTGKALSLKGVYNTGYIVIGASTVASLALAVM
jgi:succinate dehydrogenase (ubiquinone) cytochrome b560 subunit